MGTKKPLSLVWDIATRDGTLTKDAKMGNMVVVQDPRGPIAQKRPGLKLWYAYGAGQVQGVLSLVGVVCYIINNVVQQVSNTRGSPPVAGVVIPGSPPSNVLYYALPVNYYTGLPVFKSSIGGYTYNGGSVSAIAGFPTGTCAGIAFLDGTYYLFAQNTIYASAYGDPTTWPGLNTVNTNAAYGAGVAIASHLAYVVAFMEGGTQFFYDAGISPGAPIAQVQNGALSVGCLSGNSIASFEDVMYFLARDSDGSICVGGFSGLTFGRVSTPAIDKILNNAQQNAGFSPFNIYASTGLVLGKPVYLLTLVSVGITLCYDIKDGLWTYWTTTSSGFQSVFNGAYWTGGSASFYSSNNASFFIGLNDGNVYTLTQGTYQDNGQAILCNIVTPSTDENTYAMKFVEGAYLHSDTISTTVSVTYTDNDYQTFANGRNIDMSTQKKQLVNVGSYRHRAWQLLHADNTDFRVSMLELDLAPTDESNQ